MNPSLKSPSAAEHKALSERTYDVVIVGTGISGSILAKEVSERGFSVCMLEAGPNVDASPSGYASYLERFYAATDKNNNAPYPPNASAPNPISSDIRKLMPGAPDSSGYFVQNGPVPLESTYTKAVGGTTLHWQGTCLRMLPEDFAMHTNFGQGLDWPITYSDLNPDYNRSEREIGVSGDVEDQQYFGITFDKGYVLPMRAIPASYLDKVVARRLAGATVDLEGERRPLHVRSLPQGRNGIPNPNYDGGRGYVPVGAIHTHDSEIGERCQGNGTCVPICPVQAKYDARKTLQKAIDTGRVTVIPQAVAYNVEIDQGTGAVQKIHYKAYDLADDRACGTHSVRGRVFVLAANAVENAKLMLASGLHSTSRLVGRNLMDHPYIHAWGLMPEVTGTGRGPQGTSGIEEFRSGSFRRYRAAFSIDIHNDYWGWATGAPTSDLLDLVDGKNKFGSDLRHALIDRLSRQLLLAFMVEQLPDPNNRVTIDPKYMDAIGNYRPVISYNISDYSLAGMAFARQMSRIIFQRIGCADYTSYDPSSPGFVSYLGQGYVARGGNHFSGTHIMGTSDKNSVVDAWQRAWDHPNLYLVGSGSMPTVASSNTTLTLAALAFRSARNILQRLASEQIPGADASTAGPRAPEVGA
jgi:choline dehydrogenase-like flavoprotein